MTLFHYWQCDHPGCTATARPGDPDWRVWRGVERTLHYCLEHRIDRYQYEARAREARP